MAGYPNELMELLQVFLTDGIITDKERKVLLTKAQMLGVDPDEFDLYIDAQVQICRKQAAAAERRKKGNVCRSCGAMLEMFDDKCPHCGASQVPEVSKEVEELINNLEDAVQNLVGVAIELKNKSKLDIATVVKFYFKCCFPPLFLLGSKDTTKQKYALAKSNVERYIRKAKMYYANNKTIRYLIDEAESAIKMADSEIASEKKKKRNIIIAVIAVYILLLAVGYLEDSARDIDSDKSRNSMTDSAVVIEE